MTNEKKTSVLDDEVSTLYWTTSNEFNQSVCRDFESIFTIECAGGENFRNILRL